MGKKGKNRGPFSRGLIALGFIAGAVFLILFISYYTKPDKKEVEKPSVKLIPPAEVKPPEEKIPEKPAAPPIEALPKVAIVIDDMGQDLKKLKELLEVDAPITIAVLPNLKYSKQTATEANRMGREVLLHLPMEPKDLADNDPGKGALLTAMTAEEVATQTEDDIKSVPYAVGINNHMGSRFTEDEPHMLIVLKVAKKRRLFFLDSRTTSNSVAGRLARQIGVKNADRSVFLDNTRDQRYIKGQIAELVSIAKRRGYAIGIGHPYPETIEALKSAVPELNGVEVVKLSELVK